MNRDKKLGLALGVLLVGIVGAFFFRNEPAGGPELPKLENPKKLDDRIAEKPVVPYLSGIETEEPTRTISQARPRERTNRASDDWPVRTDDAWGPASPAPREDERGTLPPPQPIPISAERPVSASRNPDHNREWSTVPDVEPAATKTAQAAMTIHEVRGGETLSGLSLKYLGTPNRYNEILDANRDQIRAPKDLRVGMKVRIPPKNASASTAKREKPAEPPRAREASGGSKTDSKRPGDGKPRRAAAPARTISSSPFDDMEEPFAPSPVQATQRSPADSPAPLEEPWAPPAEPSEGKLFRAARRNPFLPGQENAATPAGGESSGSKSLSQKLPADLPEFDDAEPMTASPRPAELSRQLPERPPIESTQPAPKSTRPARNDSLAPGRYIVQRGDTLEKIGQRLFGDRAAAGRILDANRDLIEEAEDLREGMSLRIPQ